ncbi:MAG: 6-phosphogluconolactonase [Candidatus Eremiobacteraeota bacterium]|nr:6-phosphogluconolactonase [Candidatus Eremiobacteraeota bacterium]
MVVVDDAGSLARALAERFVAAAHEACERHGRFDVVLAGGSTPKAAYELLAASHFREQVDWRAVRFFFGDERCVPPDDDASNYKMAKAALGAAMAGAGAVFRMHGEEEPQSAALAYAKVLRKEAGDEPVFDLVLLGMGPDGHTASLFPGSDPRTDDAALVRAPFVAHLNAYRLTLTPRALCGGRAIVVALSGSEKAQTLREVLTADAPEYLRYPIEVLQSGAAQLTWLVDRSASAALSAARVIDVS